MINLALTSFDYYIVLQYLLLVIYPSIFLGRIVSWYFWRKYIVKAKSIIGDYHGYLIAFLLLIGLKFANLIGIYPIEASEINPPIFLFIISFLLPISITLLIIRYKNKLIVNESFKLNLNITFLKALIVISCLPIIFLYIMFIGSSNNLDFFQLIVSFPLLTILMGFDISEVTFKTLKFLKKSIKIQIIETLYKKEIKERDEKANSNQQLVDDENFDSLTNILIDEYNWKPIFLNINQIFSIQSEYEINSENQYNFDKPIGLFFKPDDDLLKLFADSKWISEEHLPKTKLENVLKKGRNIKFNVDALLPLPEIPEKEFSFSYTISSFVEIKDPFVEFFYYNLNGIYTIVDHNVSKPREYINASNKYLLPSSRFFQIKDGNETVHTLSYDLLQKRNFIFLSVND